jgi:hypothetical protein
MSDYALLNRALLLAICFTNAIELFVEEEKQECWVTRAINRG